MKHSKYYLLTLLFLATNLLISCSEPPQKEEQKEEQKEDIAEQSSNMQPDTLYLFNGKDLEGWIPKFRKYPLGENFNNTFRVEEGILKVRYDQYEKWDREFGHLFYKEPFDQYILDITYRFVGENIDLSEENTWAFSNSGVMLHSQAPETMGIDQGFPVSLEGQLLGSDPAFENRTNLNLCTPGLDVIIDGEKVVEHCIPSTFPTVPKGEWDTARFIVYGDSLIHHVHQNDTIMTYGNPTLGGTFLPDELKDQVGKVWKSRYISLQSESHPIDFKEVKLVRL